MLHCTKLIWAYLLRVFTLINVQSFNISVSNFEVQNETGEDDKEISSMTNGCNLINGNDQEKKEYKKFGETSSVEFNVVHKKPKKGVLRRFNTVLSRLFTSKL